MEANLHLHSRFSDGTLWPAEIAARAAALGLGLVALTDHDTLGGVPEFLEACRLRGLRAVAGCEIDVSAPEIGYRSELLAYFPGGDCPATAAFIGGIARRRAERLALFVERARTLFGRPELSLGELLEEKIATGWAAPPRARPGRKAEAAPAPRPAEPPLSRDAISLNKVDLFRYLQRRGVLDGVADYREFKRAYFETGLFQDGRFPRTRALDAIAAVRADGGHVVLPHPGHEFGDDPALIRRDKARLERILAWFREAGVTGVELYWYRNGSSDAVNSLVRRSAEKLGFFFTHGSDCHGPGSEKETLGDYSGEFAGFPGPD